MTPRRCAARTDRLVDVEHRPVLFRVEGEDGGALREPLPHGRDVRELQQHPEPVAAVLADDDRVALVGGAVGLGRHADLGVADDATRVDVLDRGEEDDARRVVLFALLVAPALRRPQVFVFVESARRGVGAHPGRAHREVVEPALRRDPLPRVRAVARRVLFGDGESLGDERRVDGEAQDAAAVHLLERVAAGEQEARLACQRGDRAEPGRGHEPLARGLGRAGVAVDAHAPPRASVLLDAVGEGAPDPAAGEVGVHLHDRPGGAAGVTLGRALERAAPDDAPVDARREEHAFFVVGRAPPRQQFLGAVRHQVVADDGRLGGVCARPRCRRSRAPRRSRRAAPG